MSFLYLVCVIIVNRRKIYTEPQELVNEILKEAEKKDCFLLTEDVNTEEGCMKLFSTGKLAKQYVVDMCKKALRGDVIWGQCVGCGDYPKDISQKILEADKKGVYFKMIINFSATGFSDIFYSLHNQKSEIIISQKNNLRVYGLSKKEVIFGFKKADSYTGILITDSYFVKIIKEWFDRRFEKLKRKQKKRK